MPRLGTDHIPDRDNTPEAHTIEANQPVLAILCIFVNHFISDIRIFSFDSGMHQYPD